MSKTKTEEEILKIFIHPFLNPNGALVRHILALKILAKRLSKFDVVRSLDMMGILLLQVHFIFSIEHGFMLIVNLLFCKVFSVFLFFLIKTEQRFDLLFDH